MNEKALIDTYVNYDPNEDPNGAQGIQIAELMFKQYGPDWKKIRFQTSLKKLERTALSKN